MACLFVRAFCGALAAVSVVCATGCTQFVSLECETDACDSTGESTTETTTNPPATTATTVDDTTTGTTSPPTDPTVDPSTSTSTGTDTDTDTTTGTDTGPDTLTDTDATTGDGSSTDTGMVGPVCGNGVMEGDEACDDPGGNSDTEPDTCRTDCELPSCGDTVTDTDETCDDDNTDETDGCLSTCVSPTSCAVILNEIPGLSDGTYVISPDGTPLTTACDMTTDGGGWTLIGKINNADTDDVDEPADWFATESNSAGLASPDLTLNASPESHGASRFSPIITAGDSVTRFELIEGGNVSDSVDWFKIVATTASLEAWFTGTDPDESNVCNDAALSQNCEMGRIRSQGPPENNVTSLGGMRITDYFPDGESFPVHIRQDNNSFGTTSGMISQTAGVAAWSQGYLNQSGNGLRIWLRE